MTCKFVPGNANSLVCLQPAVLTPHLVLEDMDTTSE
jgi:hypothetical protein